MGLLRQVVFQGLREDKPAAGTCMRERPRPPGSSRYPSNFSLNIGNDAPNLYAPLHIVTAWLFGNSICKLQMLAIHAPWPQSRRANQFRARGRCALALRG